MAKKSGPDRNFEPRDETDLVRVARRRFPASFSESGAAELPSERSHSKHSPDVDLSFPLDIYVATCDDLACSLLLLIAQNMLPPQPERYVAVGGSSDGRDSGWVFWRRALSPTQRPPEQIAEVMPLTAVLDFHNRTSERSVHAPVSEPEVTPHYGGPCSTFRYCFPSVRRTVSIPCNSVTTLEESRPNQPGIAKWDGTTETLSARIDLRKVEPGQYTLAVRKGTSSWRQYSIFVD